MATLIRFSPRKGAPVDAALDRRVEDGEILVGRAVSAVIRLVDRRVRFRHAMIRPIPGGFAVEALDGAKLVQNGADIAIARLEHPGDQVLIGAHAITLQAADDAGPVLHVEPGAGEGPSEGELLQRYDQALGYALPSLRRWSWALALMILVSMLLLPLLGAEHGPGHLPGTATAPAGMPRAGSAFRPDRLWVVGHMSNAHAAFAEDCALCHQKPFVSVRNEACLSCHETTGQHADPHGFAAIDLAERSCESCHREHKGAKQAISNAQADCAGCHSNLQETAPAATVLDVRDFGTAHPDFAPTVIIDAAAGTTKRIRMGGPEPIISQSNLHFTHDKHLIAGGVKDSSGRLRRLTCAECHVAEAGGGRMLTPTFEDSCAGCHELKFEPKHPEWLLPHGAPDELASRILGYYSQAVLSGESFGAAVDPLFAKPGQEPLPAELPAAMARSQAAAAMASSVARAACGTCHSFNAPGPNADPLAWRIRPVVTNPSFLPNAKFSHGKHDTMACADCHADIRKATLDQVVLPDIASCRNCHAGEAPVAGKVTSTCVSCHDFHQRDLPILSGKAKTATLWSETDVQAH